MGDYRLDGLQLIIKSVDDDQRILEGVATTADMDRAGDIVEPKGARFSLPIPFLWQHQRDNPIGEVIRAEVADDGIAVTVQIAKDDEPGPLKDLLDKAWRSIKKGLVRGLSVGFKPIEEVPIKSGGFRFPSWRWLELSAVTIPANAAAAIRVVKSDTTTTALGRLPTSPGASGPVSFTHREKVMTITEQIKGFEAERSAKDARRDELMSKAAESNQTLDETQAEEYDTLTAEIASVDKHLVRLREREKQNAEKAKAVNGTTSEDATRSRSPIITAKLEDKLDPGIEFARFAMSVAAAKGDPMMAMNLMQTHYPQQKRVLDVMKAAASTGRKVNDYIAALGEFRTKANVVAGTTTDNTWAEPLLAFNVFAGDFLEFLRPQTIIGKFGTGGIPSLRRIPFNVHIKGQTTGGSGYWVGEGKPKPVTKFDFNDTYHGWYKVAAISVLTEELIRFSDPSAERLVRDGLAGALVQVIDETFIDPAIAAVAGVSPASVTNGVTAITSSGDDADAVRADLLDLWQDAIDANLPLTSAVYITTPAIGLSLSLMRNGLGQPEFPGIGITGGVLEGVPVITSNYVPAGTFVLAFASEIWFSDDGVVTVDASREASIQMLDNPTNDSVTPTATTLVSMFQTNSVALRGERFINWTKRRTTAVALLEDVSWGGAPES